MKITEKEIKKLCRQYDITNYTINQDGSIDVDGDVYLADMILKRIPLNFNRVSGNFICNHNRGLVSLDGCPSEVGGDFICHRNRLTTLKGAPTKVGGSFKCYNNVLTSLEYCPSSVGGNFECYYNELTSLEFCPSSIGGKLECWGNQLSKEFDVLFDQLSKEEKRILLKYHHQFEVWYQGYNHDNAVELIEEIKDGLL